MISCMSIDKVYFINTLSPNMEKEYLSWTEKNKISSQKEIYLILRSIMLLKMCRGVDRIDEETFNEETAKLKKKY